MAKPYSNVQPQFDSFASWLAKTNSLLYDMSTVVITTDSTANGAVTSGNAFVNGIFSATTVAVNGTLRGGNVSTNGTLTIGSNTAIANGFTLSFGNSTVNTTINSTSFSGKSAFATALANTRNFNFTTDATGNANFDGTANVTIALTLATTGVAANTWGNSTHYAVVSTDVKGRVTGVTMQQVTLAANAAVSSFNTRTGAVTLQLSDVVTVLGYTPLSANGTGSISGSLTLTSNGDFFARDGIFSRTVSVGNSSVNTVINAANSFLMTPVMRGYKDTVNANTTMAGAAVLDLSYNTHRWIMTGNVTSLNFANVPANNTYYTGTLHITRDASTNATNRVITWPTTANATTGKTLFSGGSEPPLTGTANSVDIWQFSTIDGGNNYVWSLVVKDAR